MQDIFASDLKALYRSARELLRLRLSQRESMPTSEFLSACQTKEVASKGAEWILGELGTLLRVQPGHFRPQDRLGALLSFSADDLGAGAATVLEKYGLEQLEVCGEDVLWMLTKVADAEVWECYWRSLAVRPRTDDEWINLLMGMTLCELVNTFGVAIAA